MQKKYLLGIDIGTSSTKVLLTDYSGRRVASNTYFYEALEPYPGYVEQIAEDTWWEGVKTGISVCLSQSGIDAADIAGICASGMVPNLCPIDKDGNSVRPSILYRDNRAVEQIERLRAKYGWSFTAQDIIPKLIWIKENEPENYRRIKYLLNSHSFVSYKLTGKCSVDHDTAAIYGCIYDVKTHEWMKDRMEMMGLYPFFLPPLVWADEVVGGVTKQAAEITGLAEGTPVISGTGDSFTALTGCGVVMKNEGLIYLGTAATFLGLNKTLDDSRRKCIFETGSAVFLGNVLTGGEITHWCKDSMLKGCDIDYTTLEKAAGDIRPGCDGLIALPHLLGERTPVLDPYASGVLFGLTNAHTLGHIYRALLEGVSFALKDSFESNDYTLDRLVLVGGGCNCLLWRQIIADVMGRRLEYLPYADNALGTAFLAGLALGIFDSYRTIKDEWLKEKIVIEPIEKNTRTYQSVFTFYKELDETMRPVYARHHELYEQIGSNGAK